MPKATPKAAPASVLAWEDDPLSGADPIARPAPTLGAPPLALRFTGRAPAIKEHPPGTPAFRYWAAAEALRRAADFWASVLPAGTRWQPGDTLRINLDQGVDLNAYYDRAGLSFFHSAVKGQTVYSGESPDIVCHELGHAVLDAIRPELWDATSDEAAAFHESFGDISALLSALQLPTLRESVLETTAGKLYRTSRLSRLAEQLGWAVRQLEPDAVDRDCLRNAVNSLFYVSPLRLPPAGPASALSSEPHSFSRVFTAGFFEATGGMLATRSKKPTAADLLQVSQDAGRLLVRAAAVAPIVPDYYSQIAAHIVAADATLFRGKYADALRSAFVRRGILSLRSQAAIGTLRKTTRASAVTPQSCRLSIAGDAFGLPGAMLVVQAPREPQRFSVAAASLERDEPRPEADASARAFLEYLFRRGRVDLSGHGAGGARVLHPHARKTHQLVPEGAALALRRRTFDCGLDCA